LNAASVSNSLLTGNDNAMRLFPHQTALVAVTTVNVIGLDTFSASESVDMIDLLNVDVQGVE
jgi:hypothetical protein